jgi:hypothetical protein
MQMLSNYIVVIKADYVQKQSTLIAMHILQIGIRMNSAYYFDESDSIWQRDYFLKSDCVRYHRNPNAEGNTYIANISLDKTISIPYADKVFYFTSEEHRFNAGYVFSIDLQRWIDLKVIDKSMWGNLVLIRKRNDKTDYVANRYDSTFQSMQSSLIQTRISSQMAQCPSKHLRLYVTTNHEDVVTCFISNHNFLRSDCREYYVANADGINELIHISHTSAIRLNREETYTFTMMNGYDSDFVFSPINYNGIPYFDMASAIRNGYVNRICHSCGADLGINTSHDESHCARRNHRNSRYNYHREFSVKEIQLEQRFVFKIGCEIEKQSYIGSKHSNVEIGRRFGWKKERDGSLCDVIGYELVSPCYPLFTDDLINEAKEIENAFPSLINGNDHDLISSDKSNASCGGHIHFSRAYTSPKDLFEMISGYMPMFYAIYRNRHDKYYCKAKEKQEMKNNTSEKMQAVRIIEDMVSPRIEFRIFPLVKNIENLQWRIDLLRIMANNPTNRFNEVANMLTDKESDLYKHMLKEFSPSKIKQRILDSIEMAKKFDRDFYYFDFSSIRNAVSNM